MSGLHNPEATLWGGTKRLKRYFHVVYGVPEEPIEVQEETLKFSLSWAFASILFFKINI